MTIVNRVLLALALIAGPAFSADEHPSKMLLAFRSLCTPTLANPAASAAKAGWIAASEAASPHLSKILAVSKSSGLELLHLKIQKFGDDANPIYGVLSGVVVQGRKVHGCYVYDFEAGNMLASKQIEDWLGGPPTKRAGSPGSDQLDEWHRPGVLPGYLNLKSGFMPQGGSANSKYGLLGASLAASQLID